MNVVDQIFAYAKQNGCVNNENMLYNPQEYNFNFSLEEFYVLWNYIRNTFGGKLIDIPDHFYEYIIYLEYKKEPYVWRVMSGRCQIFSEKGWEDSNIRDAPRSRRTDMFKNKTVLLDDNLFKTLEPKYTELAIKEIIE